jgi:phosphatidylglycerophosphate synthase
VAKRAPNRLAVPWRRTVAGPTPSAVAAPSSSQNGAAARVESGFPGGSIPWPVKHAASDASCSPAGPLRDRTDPALKEAPLQLGYSLTRYVYRPISAPVASVLSRTPITPTHVTYISAALSLGGGVAFGFRAYVLGAVLTLLGSITDCVDGDLARLSETSSPAGSYLDHVFDRWTDAALILGLTFSDLDRYAAFGLFALVGTFMTSYARTKGQVVGTDPAVGIAGRDARMLLLVAAALLHTFVDEAISIALITVSLLGILTAVQRMVSAIRELDARG